MPAAVFDVTAVLDAALERPSSFAASGRGASLDDIIKSNERRFRRGLAPRLRWDVLRAADEHRAAGDSVVLTGTASRVQVLPVAEALGADDVVATELELSGDVLTGRVAGSAVFGAAKVAALAAAGVDLESSCVYASSFADVPLLSAAGEAVVVAPRGPLRELAGARGWSCVEPDAPPGEPSDAARIARSVGFWGGMAVGMSAGLALGALNRSREPLVDVGCGAGAALALAAAGVTLEVEGRENLFAARPCVFAFNHQSQLDAPLLMALLEHGYTGVGKAEVKKIPFFGQFLQIAGMAFVERTGDGRDAEALAPAITKLRDEGVCLVIAPEGTRSTTPRVGPFKTGAVRIAQEADVPVVPIVLHNPGALMARDSAAVRAGVVRVTVLEPVDVAGDPREQTDALRERFVHALAQV
ncbi:MAG: putative phosphoserine phosphatase / 1-acylglycerol-3-phosphate O-acyltransferase [Solirubrobacteraceae bacterium]|jgi:putative phosphoserine phosphatase/1-acylglycerol-3-phosphate O-acyltransferase|nr:putative phosphoserine phosphatase / 1-acylglycerol-3-phosphate O-acyltransferase [Solirubrobacteraceae bacterium]